MQWKRHNRLVCCLAVLGVSLLLPPAAETESSDIRRTPVDINIGFTHSSFTGVNEADALAAFKVFTKTVGERRGYDVTPHVRIFDDLSALGAEIERDGLHLLIVDSWEYLTITPGDNMQVVFSTIEQGVAHEDYLLLVKAGTGLTSLADLEGKRVIVLESSSATTGKHWLNTELLSLGATSPHSFFSSYTVTNKPSQAVLPVFFGNADACVVDRSGFEIMKELNPQVGKLLVVAARSDKFLDSMVCVNRSNWNNPRERADVIDALRELTTDPGGQQILSLFKFEGVMPYEDKHLETVRSLRQRHDALLSRVASQ